MSRPLLALLALLPACSIVNGTGDHQGGEIPVDQFCLEYADLGCRAHLDCCATPSVTYEQCLTEWVSACQRMPTPAQPSFEGIARDARTGYSADAAARSIARGRQLTATCDVAIVDWFVERDGLQGAMLGTVPAGGACMEAGGGFEAAPLFSCSDFSQSCRAGVPEWRCAPRLAAGSDGQCYLDLDCVEGAFCEQIGDLPGRCVAKAGEGGRCSESAGCQSLVCGAGGTCAPRDAQAIYCSLGSALGT